MCSAASAHSVQAAARCRGLIASASDLSAATRSGSGNQPNTTTGKPAAELFESDEFLGNYCELFARGLATAVLLYNPTVIVLGGGVSRVGDRLTSQLTDSLTTELASWKHLTPRITTSRFDGDGVHLGARELTRDLL